ncbi:MAG: hypothetical protein WDN48_00990 [Pseudolabrys sp.]
MRFVAVSTALFSASVCAQAQTKWDLPANTPTALSTPRTSCSSRADVEKATGGSLIITVHAAAR